MDKQFMDAYCYRNYHDCPYLQYPSSRIINILEETVALFDRLLRQKEPFQFSDT